MNEPVSAQLSDLFSGKMTPEAFADWIDQTPELKELISEEDYSSLTATDLRLEGARDSVETILRKYINWAQFEKEKLAETLMDIIYKERGVPAMIDTYKRYCDGQRFLYPLGYKYGKLFAPAQPTSRLRRHRQTTTTDQDSLFEQVYPEAAAEAKRLLGILVAERIRFTGTYTPGGCPEYVEQ